MPRRNDVASMARVLSRVSANMNRARRQRPGAHTLWLLQAVAEAGAARPSELADHLALSRGAVTRQLHELSGQGAVQMRVDPDDRRSCFVSLTAAGREQLEALDARGVDRFVLFTASWKAADIRELGRLLEKLEVSIAAAVADDPPLTRAPWRRSASPASETGMTEASTTQRRRNSP